MMSAHWSDRHGLFENENHHVSPMSPPVTVAEKAKLSLRRELLPAAGHRWSTSDGAELHGS